MSYLVLLTASAGNLSAAAAPDATSYLLPWEAGRSYAVLQGNSGSFTHQAGGAEQYAWDFDLPQDTKLLAARSGTVAHIQDKWDANHCGSKIKPKNVTLPAYYVVSSNIPNEGNYVVIDHGDGTSALYLHLKTVSVKIGDQIRQGQEIGLSGQTGWSGCYAHLHFQVEATDPIKWHTQSKKIPFSDKDVRNQNTDGVPTQNNSYISDNKLADSQAPSQQNPGTASPPNGDATQPNPPDSQTSQPPFYCITGPGGSPGPECQPGSSGPPGAAPPTTTHPPNQSVPPAPSNLAVVPATPTSIGLQWTDNSTNEAGFEVNNGVQSLTTGPDATKLTWTGLTPGTYMCFKVRAFNNAGSSAWEPGTSPYYRCATTPSAAAQASCPYSNGGFVDIVINPASGPAGTTVAAVVKGAVPGDRIQVTWNGQSYGVNVNGQGVGSLTLAVPANATPGMRIVAKAIDTPSPGCTGWDSRTFLVT